MPGVESRFCTRGGVHQDILCVRCAALCGIRYKKSPRGSATLALRLIGNDSSEKGLLYIE